ncbi:MAG: hypothetical protein Q7T64_14085 [Lacisediminimonas sp.]|nr:hypothetical protein [Lacisediminimonas sp.]
MLVLEINCIYNLYCLYRLYYFIKELIDHGNQESRPEIIRRSAGKKTGDQGGKQRGSQDASSKASSKASSEASRRPEQNGWHPNEPEGNRQRRDSAQAEAKKSESRPR